MQFYLDEKDKKLDRAAERLSALDKKFATMTVREFKKWRNM